MLSIQNFNEKRKFDERNKILKIKEVKRNKNAKKQKVETGSNSSARTFINMKTGERVARRKEN